jgi:hypothetical protein
MTGRFDLSENIAGLTGMKKFYHGKSSGSIILKPYITLEILSLDSELKQIYFSRRIRVKTLMI